ncbi:DNA internalization-related competence protein ComEC/Rec2 [Rhabdochromatium marinum]|uniref:DNA internalization-related competence protein ComEC/Rec2 n=1 Tax=Rhabdochromatium marinum TaxID=48729 RepID=UPI001F5B8DF9|nr:DNA internalization-related competence protein ComEC/Rec2 [Rhabdochromatium marinum]
MLPAAALAFAAGIGAFFLQTQRLPTPLLLLLLGLSLLLVLMLALGARRWRWLAVAIILTCGIACGFAYAHWRTAAALDQPFPESLVRQNLLIEGRIADLPDQNAQRTRFVIAIEHASHAGQPVRLPRRVRLSWYQQPPPLQAGERWRLLVRLKPAHGFVNPAGFDYERWLFQHGLGATGYVRNSEHNERLDADPGPYGLHRLRQSLRTRIEAELGATRAAALVRALVLGDRDGLSPQDWQVLTRTGTNHLLAISGLHIGLIAAVALWVGRWLWTRVAVLSLYLPAPRAAALLAMAAAIGYTALAGFAISTQRALAMLAVVLIAQLAGRTLRPWSAISLALIAVLSLDPQAILSYGFWLSFAAVSALLYALSGRLRQPSHLLRWSQAQWAVALGLLPLLLLLFGRASLIAPPVNLLAVPLFTILLPLILLATLMSLASGWALPLALVGTGLEQGFAGLAWLADLPWTSLGLGERPGWVWLAAFAGVGLLLAPRGLPARWLGLVYLLPLLLVRPVPPAPGAAVVTVLDVGQGLAVSVRTARHTLVYDLGPRYPSGFNTGAAVVLPYLRALGIRSLDVLVISHADQDHAGGLQGLVGQIPIARLLSGEPAELELKPELAAESSVRAEPCQAGQHWHWDGIDFDMLYPPPSQQLEGNDSSCVLKVTTGSASVLLTGDASQAVEAQLIARYGQTLQADVLVAGHHGSATSSSRAFLQQVQPRWMIVSAGFANRYGFPAQGVVERAKRLGIPTLNTATTGAIEFRWPAAPSAAAPLEPPKLSRQQRDRLWRHHPKVQPPTP